MVPSWMPVSRLASLCMVVGPLCFYFVFAVAYSPYSSPRIFFSLNTIPPVPYHMLPCYATLLLLFIFSSHVSCLLSLYGE